MPGSAGPKNNFFGGLDGLAGTDGPGEIDGPPKPSGLSARQGLEGRRGLSERPGLAGQPGLAGRPGLSEHPGLAGPAGPPDLPGVLVYVMGPSGAGKDSLLSAVLADPPETAGKIVLAGRLVTRGTTAPSGDVFVTPEDFERLLREKRLALHWESHGHRYGVPRAMDLALLAGALVLVNGSRAHYPRARELYPDLAGVMVTADEEVVRRRLMSRGRENPAGIAERIGRNKSLDSPPPAGVLVVDNSGPLEEAARIFRLFLAEIGGGPPKLTAACPAPSARSGL